MSGLDELQRLDAPLILYVGPELSRSAGLPTREQLFERVLDAAADYVSARQHAELRELGEQGELAEAFSEIDRAMTTAMFAKVVEQALDDRQVEVPPLARAIAALRPRLRGVITPNLDHLLERAFAGELTVFARPTADLASRKGWLLKLHGTLSDRATWVLTSAQRDSVLYRDPLHQQVFRSLFLAHPILFVGTRLDDPVLSELVTQITSLAQGQPPRHWALVDEAEAGPMRRRKFAAAGIELIASGDHADHGETLRLLASLDPGTPALPPGSQPVAVSGGRGAAEPVVIQLEPPAAAAALSILFLAANPSGTDPLRLDRELRIIREAIERSRHRTQLRLEIRTAATIHDLRRALLDGRYDLVHISGHGEREGLLLEDEHGECVEVPKQALARLFGRYAPPVGPLRCVVLNACWSLATGESMAMDVPFTVAMDGPISDRGALEFSRGFYDALGAGLDFATAYAEGRSCVELAAPKGKFGSILLRAE